MEMQTGALRAAEKSRQFRDRIAAVHAYRTMRGIDPEPHWPGMWMWDLIELPQRQHRERIVPLARIIQLVCKRYQFTENEILSPSRYGPDVRARHIAFYLARKHTNNSFTNIGRKFGRDHTTVLYGYGKVAERVEADPLFKAEIEALVRSL